VTHYKRASSRPPPPSSSSVPVTGLREHKKYYYYCYKTFYRFWFITIFPSCVFQISTKSHIHTLLFTSIHSTSTFVVARRSGALVDGESFRSTPQPSLNTPHRDRGKYRHSTFRRGHADHATTTSGKFATPLTHTSFRPGRQPAGGSTSARPAPLWTLALAPSTRTGKII